MMTDDLLVLLEDGPHQPGLLAAWVGCDTLTCVRELKRLQKLGVTASESRDGRVVWSLTGQPLPATQPLRKLQKALRQEPPTMASESDPAWWTKPMTEEEFSAEARHQFDSRLCKTKLPARLFPNRITGAL